MVNHYYRYLVKSAEERRFKQTASTILRAYFRHNYHNHEWAQKKPRHWRGFASACPLGITRNADFYFMEE